MRIFGFYLVRLFLSRFFLILFGITAFALALDLFTYGTDVTRSRPGDNWALAEYAWYSLPGIMSQFMSMVSLLAVLLTLTELSRYSELVAMWTAGASQMQIFLILLPVGIFVGLLHFVLDDRAVPAASTKLYDWGVGKYENARYTRDRNGVVWMRSDMDVVRADLISEDTGVLKKVSVFRRDASGKLLEQIEARQARRDGEKWALDDAVIYSADNGKAVRVKSLMYYGSLRPVDVSKLKGVPAEMSIAELNYFARNGGFGIRPAYVYETWVHRRITTFLTGFLALLIAVPLAHKFRRGGGFGILFLAGIAGGFAYFIFSGVALAMGQAGVLPPWMAGWIAPLTLLVASGTVALQFETPR
ncbi:MAG TPA: YjgP/YjgQ family permease [Rhodobacteraceae bacterium]|nr:YjgP/YjgQ family permease [Paracoccaceae bacterium]